MQQLIKRIMSMLLVFCLLLNTMPLAAFATEMESTPESDPTVTEAAPTETTAPVEDSALLVLSDTLEAQPTTVEPASTETEPIETTTATEPETEPTTVVTEPVTEPAAAASSEVSFTFKNGKITGCNPGSATEIVIPEQIDNVTVTQIFYSAFEGMTGITSVTIPDTVTVIYDNAFNGCTSLTSITIPGSVKEVHNHAFKNCTSLTSAVLESGVESVKQCVFENCSNLQSVSLPDTLTEIGDMSFTKCTALTEVTIPGSVEYVGHHTFSGCTALASVTIEEGVKELRSNSFWNCISLTNISFPSTLTHIGEFIFAADINNYVPLVKDLDLSHTQIDAIPQGAFFNNECLETVKLPETVTLIGVNAFRHCINLTSVDLPASLTTLGNSAFYDCYKLKSAHIPHGVTVLDIDTFCWCSALEEVTIPDSVHTISDFALRGCTSLTTVEIPDSVTSIGQGAFQDSTALESIVIPDSVTSLGTYAFFNCPALTNVVIGEGITAISDFTFQSCGMLKSVTIGGSVKSIGNYAFNTGSGQLTELMIPNSVESIGTCAFQNCYKLQNLTIPESVVSISDFAFQQCHELNSIWFMNKDVSLGGSLFLYVENPCTIYGYSGSTAEAYANLYGHPFKNLEPRKLSVQLMTPEETALTEGFTVTWYDEEDNAACTTPEFADANADTSYRLEIAFEDSLAVQYVLPESQTVEPGSEDTVITITLEPIPTLSLTGKAADQAGSGVAGASVTVTVNGTTVEKTASTDSSGKFTVEVPALPVTTVIRKDGYYSSRSTVDLSGKTDSYDLGNCLMVETVTDHVSLSITLIPSSEDPDSAATASVSSATSLNYTVTGEDGRSITGYEIQGSSMVFLPDAVRANETITILVSDPTGQYLSSGAVSVALNSSKVGSATLTLTEKGRIRLKAVTGCISTMTLFDAQGNNIWTAPAEAMLTSAPLSAGTYTMVLMETNNLIRSVSKLSQLSTLGLVNGTDYVQKQFNVVNGTISVWEEAAVPTLNTAKLTYTLDEGTSVTMTKASGMAVGELFMLRLEYARDPAKGVSANTVQAILSEGIFPAGSAIALVDNIPTTYSYDASSRTISVNVSGKDSAVVHIYCQAGGTAGEFPLTGCIGLSNGVTQPIGTLRAKVANASMQLPGRVSSATIIASGTTAPNAVVTLYSSDTKAATTTANAAGSWSVKFTLPGETYSYSHHMIHALITADIFDAPVVTEEQLVTYDTRTIALKKITMYNTGDYGEQETVFDFTSTDTAVPNYLYNPNLPTFTFLAEFSGNADLEDVYVVTTNNYGDKTYVPMTQRSDGKWIGTCDYPDTANVPAQVGTAYTVASYQTMPYDEAYAQDLNTLVKSYAEIATTQFTDAFSEFLTVTCEEDTGISTFTFEDSETKETRNFAQLYEQDSALPTGTTAASLRNDGYSSCGEGKENIFVKMILKDNVITTDYADLNQGIVHTATLDFNPGITGSSGTAAVDSSIEEFTGNLTDWASQDYVTDGFDVIKDFMFDEDDLLKYYPELTEIKDLDDFKSNLEFLFKDIPEISDTIIDEWNLHLGNVATLEDNLLRLEERMREICPDGTYRMDTDEFMNVYNMINGIKNRINSYKTRASAALFAASLTNLPSIFCGVVDLKSSVSGKQATIFSGVDYLMGLLTDITDNNYRKGDIEIYNSIMSDITACAQWIAAHSKKCDDPEPPEDEDPDPKPVEPRPDPSGYVYEAVPSNRLENVTATIYYKDSSGNPVKWDAAKYNQSNPQVTGADGMYRWDVTFGDWKVTFTKNGYEPTDTSKVEQAVDGWLPVPPPQLNINVGMVSTAAPTVRYATAYTDQAELVFSQYMNIESVRNAVKLTRNGAAVSVTVKALDAEYDLAGEHQYATRFALIPTGGLTGSVLLSVSTGAKNYAGTALESAYTSPALTPEEHPTELNGPDSVTIGTGEEVTIALTLQPCVPGKTLQVESLTPNLVSVLADAVITDENGRAIIRVKGNLPGSGRITVTEPISGLRKTIIVDTQNPADDSTVQSVIATLEDGTVVTTGMTIPAGSKITLTTEDENAVIRYTLNNTCPCKEAALTYSEPILITGDTMLRAAACRDGVYSATIKISLKAEGILGDFTGDGETTDADVAYLVWHLLFPNKFPITGTADFVGNDGVNLADAEYLLWHVLFPSVYSL